MRYNVGQEYPFVRLIKEQTQLFVLECVEAWPIAATVDDPARIAYQFIDENGHLWSTVLKVRSTWWDVDGPVPGVFCLEQKSEDAYNTRNVSGAGIAYFLDKYLLDLLSKINCYRTMKDASAYFNERYTTTSERCCALEKFIKDEFGYEIKQSWCVKDGKAEPQIHYARPDGTSFCLVEKNNIV